MKWKTIPQITELKSNQKDDKTDTVPMGYGNNVEHLKEECVWCMVLG
jgi:hypothetical protein